MTATLQNRRPAGLSGGGQFSTTMRPEADLDLGSMTSAPATATSCGLCASCREAQSSGEMLDECASVSGSGDCVLTPQACGCADCRH